MSRKWRWKKNLLNMFLFIYFCLWGFALFNYKSHCIYSHPESLMKITDIAHDISSKCHVNFEELDIVNVDIFNEPTLEQVIQKNPHVQNGGKWRPKDCSPWQSVAIIIPYRDRWQHLKKLLNRLHPMLWKQKIDYHIFVIEQRGSEQFNRGKLMNVGFTEALKVKHFDCFVLHDVDLIPEHDKNYYLCDHNARQLSSAIDEMRYHVMFYNYAGGVIALKTDNFKSINGYSNSYWGWGNEDDDLSARIQSSGLLLTRPPEYIGRYKMVRHHKASRSENGYNRFLGWRGRWASDGLNSLASMNYTRLEYKETPLYTNVTVDIGYPPKDLESRFLTGTKESLSWFLWFYFP